MIRKLFLTFLLLVMIVGGTLGWVLFQAHAPATPGVLVDIAPGTSTRQIAADLAAKGVIERDWPFLVARALNPSATLQAGEYSFDKPLSVLDVFNKIASGEIFFRELVVPEGNNMFDIAAAVEKLGLMKSQEFLKECRNAASIHDLAPAAVTLEGFLFPSTYRVTRTTTAADLTREMTGAFRKVWKSLGKPDVDVNRIVTLASLVEKETGVSSDRKTVASVYANRLGLGMKLDCDPTTIYAALLMGKYRGTLYRSDLDSTHPYNTYRNPGLPPGPIANPGLASLQASVDPAKTDFLFFVAKPDGSGGHIFSRTLSEHDKAVKVYRSALR